MPKTTLSNKQKRDLAYVLICQAANISEKLQCGETAYMEEIKDFDHDAVAEQLAKWLSHLPGNSWDARLPVPNGCVPRNLLTQ